MPPHPCRGELLRRGRTVILATNQLQFVQDADQVLFMSGGKVAEQGRFQALMSAGGQFAGMMKEVQVCTEPASMHLGSAY